MRVQTVIIRGVSIPKARQQMQSDDDFGIETPRIITVCAHIGRKWSIIGILHSAMDDRRMHYMGICYIIIIFVIIIFETNSQIFYAIICLLIKQKSALVGREQYGWHFSHQTI